MNLIQQKLSGVYNTQSIDIPFDIFKSYISLIESTLIDRGMNISTDEIMSNSIIRSTFDNIIKDEILTVLLDIDFNWCGDDGICNALQMAFPLGKTIVDTNSFT